MPYNMAAYSRNSAYDMNPRIWNLYVARLIDDANKYNPKSATHDNNRKNKGQCVYVGCTTWTPKKRFDWHKYGYQAKKNILPDYFDFLIEDLFEHLNLGNKRGLETYEQASKRELMLAEELESKGYIVWCYAN